MPCYRFPCTVDNCKKEYRTKWELNSHQRQKHSKSDSVDELNDKMESYAFDNEMVCELIEEIEDDVKPKKCLRNKSTMMEKVKTDRKPRKRRSNQQIIYVMPGPIEDVNVMNK